MVGVLVRTKPDLSAFRFRILIQRDSLNDRATDHTAADAPGHLTKGGVNYPNMSFTLADAHNFQIPPEFQGGRIWMSIKEPLYIAVNATDTGYAGPDPINTLDPNYSTVYDWFELAYKTRTAKVWR